LEIEARIAELNPELVLGTQMERHIAKRLGVPCAVISAPVHVQDFPARYSPQMGFEGANVLFDTWVHPLMMGLEEHLIGMFRGDSEFHEDAAPSHLGGGVHVQTAQAASAVATVVSTSTSASASASASTPVLEQINAPALNQGASQTNASILIAAWDAGAEKELKKIPFFVRGKARRNTEKYAIERGVTLITTETLYESKAYYSQS
jgi:light-independent protochlorophyllide reductase subunit B